MKFLRFLETRRCLSVPSIAHGMVSNVEVPSSMSARGTISLRLSSVKIHGLDTTWRPENTRKQHKILCKGLKAKKLILHTILSGVGALSTSHTQNHFKELGLYTQKAHDLWHKTALKSHAYSVLHAHKLSLP